MRFQSCVDFILFRRMLFNRNPGLLAILYLTVLFSLPAVLYCALPPYPKSPRMGTLQFISPFALLLLLRILIEYALIRYREKRQTADQ